MDNVTDFFSSFLTLTADFLGSDPIIYVFALVCLILIIKVFRQLLP